MAKLTDEELDALTEYLMGLKSARIIGIFRKGEV